MHAVCSFSGRSRLSQQPPTLSVPQFLVEPEPGVSQGRPTRVASRFASSLAQLHPAESSLRADPSWDSIVTDWQFTSSCSPRTHYCAAVTFSHRPGELRPGRDSHPAMLVRFTVALATSVTDVSPAPRAQRAQLASLREPKYSSTRSREGNLTLPVPLPRLVPVPQHRSLRKRPAQALGIAASGPRATRPSSPENSLPQQGE
jgi:hypothetical protein